MASVVVSTENSSEPGTPAADRTPDGVGRIWVGLACLVPLLFALLFFPGYLPMRDAIVRFQVAEAIQQGHLYVNHAPSAFDPANASWYTFSDDGLIYGRYPIFHSLLMLLPMAVFDNQRGAALVFPLLAPLTLLVAWGTLTRAGYAPRPALRAALWTSMCTMMAPYSRDSHDNYLHALLLLVTIWGLLEQKERHWGLWIAGTAMGMFLNTKLWMIAAIPACLWLLPRRTLNADGMVDSVMAWIRALFSRKSLIAYGIFLLGVLPWLALYWWYADLKFGTLFGDLQKEGGAILIRPHVALAGILISPSKSIFLYSPSLLLCLPLLLRVLRRKREFGIALLLGIFGFLGMTCMYEAWHGDMGWGPRYVLPCVALAGLALAEFDSRRMTSLLRGLAAIVLILSLAVQVVGSSVHAGRYFVEQGHTDVQYLGDPTYHWYFTTEPAQFRSAIAGFPDVVSRTVDGITTGGERRTQDLAIWRHVLPGLQSEAERAWVEQRIRLLQDDATTTLSTWWAWDMMHETRVAWPRPLRVALPLLFSVLLLALGIVLSRRLADGRPDDLNVRD
jgi:hypothetical protein